MKNRTNAKPKARRLFLENLERREVLAGTVLATLSAGTLKITGDAARNSVVIWQDADGNFNVLGRTSSGGTMVKAKASDPNPAVNNNLPIVGKVTNITFDGGAENDTVAIFSAPDATAAGFIATGLSALPFIGAAGRGAALALLPPAIVSGRVTINGAAGNDTATLAVNGGPTGVPGVPKFTSAIVFNGGSETGTSQNDVLNVGNTFANSLTATTYNGNDRVSLGLAVIPTININVGGTGTQTTDNDDVELSLTAALSAIVSLGAASTSGDGNDFFASNVLIANLSVTGDKGVDDVELFDVGVLNASFNLGAGDDSLEAEGLKAGLSQQDFIDLAEEIGPLPFGLDNYIKSIRGIPGSVSINTGEGSDEVELVDVDVATSLAITLAGGLLDTLAMEDVITQIANINTGEGEDEVAIDGLTATLSLSLTLGGGLNTVDMFDVATKTASITGGKDGDDIEATNFTASSLLSANLGAGENFLSLTTVLANSVSVTGGAGVDTVTIDGLTALNGDPATSLTISLLGGADVLSVSNVSTKAATLNSGEGDDEVTLTNVAVVNTLSVIMAGGVDTLTTTTVTAKTASLNGGAGIDTFNDDVTTTGTKSVVSFP
ncbi:hypothetical protein ETAA8_25810 [Anatilimnocola aggregata]|uniref:Uncharacterized protein n=1 Tax=Anatilimnocola aggregata TaxID=2528021 RepID=A0A517YB62_9BACT|nr:hypothetical protein [Anatilimnocola aggregata]QDU27493.1 hypothetical protein ETAA8_25810 [Anatilimnocola aggregata]